MTEPDKLNQLTSSHGALPPSHGMVSGVTALSLPFLGIPGVCAFRLPRSFPFRSQG